jgi:hypothetical protein
LFQVGGNLVRAFPVAQVQGGVGAATRCLPVAGLERENLLKDVNCFGIAAPFAKGVAFADIGLDEIRIDRLGAVVGLDRFLEALQQP